MWSSLLAVLFIFGSSVIAVEWLELKPTLKNLLRKPQNNTLKVSYAPYEHTWQKFKTDHGKEYKDDLEETYRYNLFMRSIKEIEEHNTLYMAGKKSFYLGVNQFADMRVEEFMKYNGFRSDLKKKVKATGCSSYMKPNYFTAPKSVDWRQKGYVTPVKNQGQCGSCWSFSTTGSLEGQYFRKNSVLKSFSEQQLIDCSNSFGDHACQGGLMDFAFDYVETDGIELETDYPYEAKEGTCRYKKSEVVTKDTGCIDVTHGEESALQTAVATVGPISVAIDASHRSFQLYSGGVYDEVLCSSSQLDHGVLAVGYGSTDESEEYWIVKNSWGDVWGEKGYVRMSRNKNNQCGIATQASYPLM